MKTILITGGAGFIGKNLISRLIKYHIDLSTDEQSIIDLQLVIIDNFITSDKLVFNNFVKELETSSLKSNININISLLYLDICNLDFCEIIKSDYPKIDEIYHLASLASPVFYKMFPLNTLDTGYIGTRNILELSKYFGSKLLFASTSEVYGDPLTCPQTEDYYGNVNTFGSRSCYDISKRVAETLCYTYINQFGLDIKIARIFNTYGPQMNLHDGRIVTEVIKHLINNTTLTIYGDGRQTRSMCYVSDTVDMLLKLMDSDCNIPVNIGNNQELSINEIVDRIQKVYKTYHDKNSRNSVLDIKYIPLTENDPLKRQPCLERNTRVLGKTNYINIENGILETIKYFT